VRGQLTNDGLGMLLEARLGFLWVVEAWESESVFAVRDDGVTIP
jgi:hypothetical protein